MTKPNKAFKSRKSISKRFQK